MAYEYQSESIVADFLEVIVGNLRLKQASD